MRLFIAPVETLLNSCNIDLLGLNYICLQLDWVRNVNTRRGDRESQLWCGAWFERARHRKRARLMFGC